MGILDKLTGRAKKAAGDLADDPSLRREGRLEERKGEAKDDLARADERAGEKRGEAPDLERNPSGGNSPLRASRRLRRCPRRPTSRTPCRRRGEARRRAR